MCLYPLDIAPGYCGSYYTRLGGAVLARQFPGMSLAVYIATLTFAGVDINCVLLLLSQTSAGTHRQLRCRAYASGRIPDACVVWLAFSCTHKLVVYLYIALQC